MLVAIIAAGNAQFFVEGNIRVVSDSNPSYDPNIYPLNNLSIDITPQAGYWLNDNIAVGTKVSLKQTVSKYLITDPADPNRKIEKKISTPEWGISAFGRYKLWGKEKFSLLVDGSIGIDRSSSKEKTGSANPEKLNTRTKIGISAYPLISYDLNDKFSMVAVCHFLRLDLYSYTVKNENNGEKYRNNHIGFHTQSTIFSSLAGFKIGFIYNF